MKTFFSIQQIFAPPLQSFPKCPLSSLPSSSHGVWWENIFIQSWVVTVLYADVCKYVCTGWYTGCGSFLGGTCALCHKNIHRDIKRFLPRWLTYNLRYAPPAEGQKPRLFATPFCNSITLWLTTLRKYPVKEGTGYSWRILFPDGWQKLIAGVWGGPTKCQNVDLSILENSSGKILENWKPIYQ